MYNPAVYLAIRMSLFDFFHPQCLLVEITQIGNINQESAPPAIPICEWPRGPDILPIERILITCNIWHFDNGTALSTEGPCAIFVLFSDEGQECK